VPGDPFGRHTPHRTDLYLERVAHEADATIDEVARHILTLGTKGGDRQ
jgi:hypothetical protein